MEPTNQPTNARGPIVGIELNVPEKEYRAALGVTQSLLRELAKSPAHYRAALTAERKQTPSMRLGTLAHMAVFQPVLFDCSIAVAPDMHKNSKGYKEFELTAQARGKEIITAQELAQCEGMVKAVKGHPTAAALLEQEGYSEVSVGCQCPETGLFLKGRFDWYDRVNCVIIDLKTTSNAMPDKFTKSVADFHYHWQAAHYLEMARLISEGNLRIYDFSFIFVVVETEPPHGVMCYRIHPQDLDRAVVQRMTLLKLLADCEAKNEWPCYPDGIEFISLPRWARELNP